MTQTIAPPPTLTKRELECLQLAAFGYKRGAIAAKLWLSDGTIKTHMRNALGKLGASTQTQAVARAIGLGLIRALPSNH